MLEFLESMRGSLTLGSDSTTQKPVLPGQDVGTLLAGPVAHTLHQLHLLALLVAEAQQLAAHVLLQHEVVIDAARHVREPHVQGALAVNVGKLSR